MPLFVVWNRILILNNYCIETITVNYSIPVNIFYVPLLLPIIWDKGFGYVITADIVIIV